MHNVESAESFLQPFVDNAFASMVNAPTETWMDGLTDKERYAVAVGMLYAQANNNGLFGWAVVNDWYTPTKNTLVEFISKNKPGTKTLSKILSILGYIDDILEQQEEFPEESYYGHFASLDKDFYKVADDFIIECADIIGELV